MTTVLPLDRAWQFRRLPAAGEPAAAWTDIDLPHVPFVPDLDGRNAWFGECEYRRLIARPDSAPGGPCRLYVDAAMHSTVVSVDGEECGRHTGGFLPFAVDLTERLRDGRPHTLTLRLDNRDNPDVPPGKPHSELDFCWYGGLYRHVELRCHPPVYLTDPIAAGAVASGGIFVRTLTADADRATVSVRTHLHNVGPVTQPVEVEVGLYDGDRLVAHARQPDLDVNSGTTATVDLELTVAAPRLWQPDSPALHQARVTLRSPDGSVLDRHTERFGIRRIAFSRSGGFSINGRRIRPRGTNRHQDHPFAGHAVPAAAQRRDARRIKEAGFDYVRLSHYPQSPDFLDACDELGVLVMNCISGWQFIGGERFRAACRRNAREVIRRDRNHPCVVLWELSLNETPMDEPFMARLHAIGHEEYPGDQMFTCGWLDRYDVFIHSRQHGEIHRWKNDDKALVVAEYGDWEFYASNLGFDQKTGAGVYPREGNSRQRRADGERGLRQQAHNLQIALDDTLSSPAVMDGQWSMFDYARGYDPERAACGVMDIFRLPKFSYYFYRSQRDATESGANWTGGPMVFIASHWTAASALTIPVFTNGEEVELRLNGQLIGRKRPAHEGDVTHLPHPPCVFTLSAFIPGQLEATALIDGKPVATHRIATPGTPTRIELRIDTVGLATRPEEPDLIIAHAEIVDAAGSLCIADQSVVKFHVDGDVRIEGPATVTAEAGVASVVLRRPAGGGEFRLHASWTDGEKNGAAGCECGATDHSPAAA